ncbi:MAG: AraC family transcriptional regulator [Gelidibacter sp.]
MNKLFQVYRVDAQEAQKIASEPNTPHTHDFEEILIGMEGYIEHFIDFESTIFEAPYVCFITKGKMHRVKPIPKDGKCDVWVIRFASEFAAETIFQLYTVFHNKANVFWPLDRKSGRIPLLTEMMHEELSKSNPDFSLIRHLLNAVIAIVLSEKYKQDANPTSTNQSETFTNFLTILEENFRRPLGLDFYSEKLFMSSRNLNLICQKILQQSVSEIVEMRKLIEAKNLLTTTDKTISEIAYELGYKENSYFSNVFKKKTEQTPGEFREEMRKILTS